jgi:hypothetical protein
MVSAKSAAIRLCFLTLLIASCACAQTASVRVQIVNIPPRVADVQAPPVVKSGGSDVAWCLAGVEDLNSFRDVKVETLFVGIPSEGGFVGRTGSDFLSVEQTSVIRGVAVAGFVLGADAPVGKWACVAEAADTAEDKGENRTDFQALPTACGNGVSDGGEEAADCGGQCVPCTCGNGVRDGGEEAVDCGGQCRYCTSKGALALTMPSALNAGEVATIQAKSGNNGVSCLMRATRPDGKLLVFKTDDSGVWGLQTEEPGIWRIQADLYGYVPTEGTFEVRGPPTNYLIPAAVIALIIIVALHMLMRRRRRISMAASLQKG